MPRSAQQLRVENLLLPVCILLTLWSGVSCRDSFNGGRKALKWASSPATQNDVEQLLALPSFVCKIVTDKRDSNYCFGTLVTSRWLLTTSSCAPKDLVLSRNEVRVVCGRTSSSPRLIQKEYNVVEVHPLRRATTGERQEPVVSLLKLDADAPGPFAKFEESDGPDFYSLEQKEVIDTFFEYLDVGEMQTQDTWQNTNIDLIGLPLVEKPSTMRNRDRSGISLHQITTCYLATACQRFTDGVKRCTFSRIAPLELKSLCLATGTCNEALSASRMTPSFHRSLSASTKEDSCLDSPRLVRLAERRLIPPFGLPLFCSDDVTAKLHNMPKEQMMSKLKRLVNRDDATSVSRNLTCSEFDINALDNHDETLLHDAAWHNSSRSAKVLCDLGIKTEVRNKQGKTALLVAANRTSFETLKVIILNCRANVNASDSKGRTALYFAAFHNSSKIAEALCDKHIDLEAKDNKGKSALIVAAKRGSLATFKVIMHYNASVNAKDNRNRTALYYAAKICNAEMIELLKQKKADASIKDDKGKTALDLISNPSSDCHNVTLQNFVPFLPLDY